MEMLPILWPCWEWSQRRLGVLLPTGWGIGMTTLGSKGRDRGKLGTKVQGEHLSGVLRDEQKVDGSLM